jgi:hypothetical protein
MPVSLEVGVIIDPHGRAEGQSAVGAARKHYIGCAAPGREDACQHVNVVVCRAAGAINRQEAHSIQASRVYSAAAEVAAHVDRG